MIHLQVILRKWITYINASNPKNCFTLSIVWAWYRLLTVLGVQLSYKSTSWNAIIKRDRTKAATLDNNETEAESRLELSAAIASSVYLTAYDDTNLKISKKTGILGWRDRPSKLSVGDYVFVYNTETDTIETCFEIKSLSRNEDHIWHEETNSQSSKPIYAYRWNAIVKAENLSLTNNIIFGFEPFKSDKKNFSMLIRNKHPRSLTGTQYNEFRIFLLHRLGVSEEQENYLLLLTQPDTKWDDKEGSEYHYGNNVPNYTKIFPNSHVIFWYLKSQKMELRDFCHTRLEISYGYLKWK